MPADERSFWTGSALCAAAALACLWIPKYLPMVDLAQHAAQVAILGHLRDAAYGFAGHYRLNWFEPYWIGYGSAWLLSRFLPVLAALKVVLSAGVLLLPLSLRSLLARAGGEPGWSILGFPVAFGYAFYGGFFTYLVAVPVGLFFLARVYAFAAAPTARHGAALAALGVALFFCHFAVFAAVGLVAAAVIATSLPPRDWWRGALAGALPAALALAWAAHHPSSAGSPASHLIWRPSLLRLAALPITVLGFHGQLPTAACFFALMILPALGGLRFVRASPRLAPLATILALYVLVPEAWAAAGGGLGSGYVYQRLAIFVLPFVLLACSFGGTEAQRRLAPWLATGAALAFSALCLVQFVRFDREARSFDAVVDRLPGDASLLALGFDESSPAVPGLPVYEHFGAWAQAWKGGALGFSFALADFQAAQLDPLPSPEAIYRRLLVNAEPDLFDWDRDGGFDWFLLRAPEDPGPRIFPTGRTSLALHAGDWWLYRKTGALGLTAGTRAH